MSMRLDVCLACFVLGAGCATPRQESTGASAEAASAAVARLVSSEPATFKMLHQVVARAKGRTYPMSGYLLGRQDGSFRVSAWLPIGPKLFDVVKVSGRWESKVYLPEATAYVDPLEIGHAVERIYFRSAEGPLQFEEGAWVTRQSITAEDADSVEVWRSPEDFSVFRKRFLRRGRPVLEIAYKDRSLIRGQLIARQVLLTDARGFSLELNLMDYEPGFPVPEERLQLGN